MLRTPLDLQRGLQCNAAYFLLLLQLSLPYQLLLAGDLFLLFLPCNFGLQLRLLSVGERIHVQLATGDDQTRCFERVLPRLTTGHLSPEAKHSPDLQLST